MKIVFLLSILMSLGFSNTSKEICSKNLKDLYQLNIKLQENRYQYEQSYYEKNIYAEELFLEFIKKDIKKIKNISNIALVNCKNIISRQELVMLEEKHFYNGELLKN